MPKLSAALLLHKVEDGVVSVLIVHPGGPFWAKKDDGAWSIPKGEYEEGEVARDVAYREFEEEIGLPVPDGSPIELGELKQPSGKRVTAWALRCGGLDLSSTKSNLFEMEWPRGSGKVQSFPEVDRVEWFTVRDARVKLLKGHVPFLDRLMAAVRDELGDAVDEGASSGDVPPQGQLF